MNKHMKAVGHVLKRRCPKCYRYVLVTITETDDGWEHWDCHSCKQRKSYKVRL